MVDRRVPGAQKGEQLTPAGHRILASASHLFYYEGINAVGVERIAADAGVTKKTLYDIFGSKGNLVHTYLSHRDERWRRYLVAAVDRAEPTTPAECAAAVFGALGTWVAEESPRGCSFTNAMAEMADSAHSGRAVVIKHKEWLLEYFTELMAGLRKEFRESTARAVFLLYEGALAATGSTSLADPIGDARKAAIAYIEAVAS